MGQSKEKLRAMREKYHLGEYSRGRAKRTSHKRTRSRRAPGRSNRGGNVARRRYSRSSGGGSMLKQALFGAAAGAAVQYISPIKGPLPCGAAGFLVGKLPGAVGGVAASMFLGGSLTNPVTGEW